MVLDLSSLLYYLFLNNTSLFLNLSLYIQLTHNNIILS